MLFILKYNIITFQLQDTLSNQINQWQNMTIYFTFYTSPHQLYIAG